MIMFVTKDDFSKSICDFDDGDQSCTLFCDLTTGYNTARLLYDNYGMPLYAFDASIR